MFDFTAVNKKIWSFKWVWAVHHILSSLNWLKNRRVFTEYTNLSKQTQLEDSELSGCCSFFFLYKDHGQKHNESSFQVLKIAQSIHVFKLPRKDQLGQSNYFVAYALICFFYSMFHHLNGPFKWFHFFVFVSLRFSLFFRRII